MPHFMRLVVVLAAILATRQQPSPALKILVLEGEDAVNVIQQKTAVAPVVEVRDRNSLPVVGATVTFTVGQGATFGGAATITVVTNAAGQAAATGLTPTVAGTLQVQAAVAFQGQTAIATITQSNVLTAAQAVGASGAATGSGASAGGGAGGGLSNTVLLAAGGAAAAGAAVAVVGRDESKPAPMAIAVEPTGRGIRDVTDFVFTTVDGDASQIWDFGDGQIASGSSVRHIFRGEGRFIVTAKIPGAQPEPTASLTVEVGSMTGTWSSCPDARPLCVTATIVQDGTQFGGRIQAFDPLTGVPPGAGQALSGRLTSPRTLQVFTEEGGCRLQLTNGVIDPTLTSFQGSTTQLATMAGCINTTYQWGLQRK